MVGTPDGMGADMHRERQNMKESKTAIIRKEWQLVALDEDGEQLYETELFRTEEEAQEAADDLNREPLPDRLPDEVARFEPDKRDISK